MKKNLLFWLPAIIGTSLSIVLLLIGTLNYCNSDQYKKYIEANRIDEVEKAIDSIYKTRKSCDILKALTYANNLNKEDQKEYTEKIAKIENDINKINRINKSFNKLKKDTTLRNLAEAQKAIDDLNDNYFKKEKVQFIKRLNDYNNEYENKYKKKKLIALTFDDGPNPTTTPQLLKILETKNIPVTFFALGENAQEYPDIIAQEAKNDHEVASHTWDHKDLQTLSEEEQKNEILNANQLINKITGQNISLYRPPYGSYNDNILKQTQLTVVNWSVDTNDWRYNNSEPVIENAVNYAYDGAIILMHDIHPWSVEAVPKVIDRLHQEGYTFVTVSTLLKVKHGSIKAQSAYFD